ncbi:aldo/keto reductase [Guptibacillus hwajinpoensis]|uniref:Diketogulonate reductase-like aldo/keto reductase n=1 Tax=Guptibacillus hwajinpoensis TaxID=208199 RepID=A0ABU0K1F8_9BACL|nr:aldo/keto reductase [Alkalihalobacillus hemicentroti]MDQ0483181.1 diketogulonate reductase-like aldo/keto reductase [Alkalihalobacillus hemicentroti]
MAKQWTTTTLHNGVEMPTLGLGVWKMENNDEVKTAVQAAIDAGYKAIDTAAAYKNEEGVGAAIKDSSTPREDLFITSKVWNDDQGYESTLKAFEDTVTKLGVDTLDLYLIHWPVEGKYKETWKAMEKLYKDGRIRAIGVSNFHPAHLEDLMKDAEIKPMVNQVEFHPLLNQQELRDYCNQHSIQLEAWSPLAQGKLLDNDVVKQIADQHGKSTAQVIIRWDLEHEVVTIPKSSNPERIKQNFDVFDFELTKDDIRAIDELNQNERMGPDPDHFDF